MPDWSSESVSCQSRGGPPPSVVLVSAINEDLDRISVRYGAQVFRESFLKSAEAGRMGVPTVPLSDLYSHAIAYIERRDGKVHLRTSVEGALIEPNSVVLQSGRAADPAH